MQDDSTESHIRRRNHVASIMMLRVLHLYRSKVGGVGGTSRGGGATAAAESPKSLSSTIKTMTNGGGVGGERSEITWSALEARTMALLCPRLDAALAAAEETRRHRKRHAITDEHPDDEVPQVGKRVNGGPNAMPPLSEDTLKEIAAILASEVPVPPSMPSSRRSGGGGLESQQGGGGGDFSAAAAATASTSTTKPPSPPNRQTSRGRPGTQESKTSDTLRPAAAGRFPPLLAIPVRTWPQKYDAAPQMLPGGRVPQPPSSASSSMRPDHNGTTTTREFITPALVGSFTARIPRPPPPVPLTVPWATSTIAPSTSQGSRGSPTSGEKRMALVSKTQDPWWHVVLAQKEAFEAEQSEKLETLRRSKEHTKTNLDLQLAEKDVRKQSEQEKAQRDRAMREAHEKALKEEGERAEREKHEVSAKLQKELFLQLEAENARRLELAEERRLEQAAIREEQRLIRLGEQEAQQARRAKALEVQVHALVANEAQQKEREQRRVKEKEDDAKYCRMMEERLRLDEEKCREKLERIRYRQERKAAIYQSVREREAARESLIVERAEAQRAQLNAQAERAAVESAAKKKEESDKLRTALASQMNRRRRLKVAEADAALVAGQLVIADAAAAREEEHRRKLAKAKDDAQYREALRRQLEERHEMSLTAAMRQMSDVERKMNAQFIIAPTAASM